MLDKRSLKLRLTLIIGFLAVFSAFLFSQIASYLSRSQIESDQSALLQNIALRMSSQLSQDMSTRANEILFLANQESIRDGKVSDEKKREIFERTRNAYPFYSWIGITDDKGNIVAGTDGLLVGVSVAQRDWFLKGRESLNFGDAHDAFLLAKMLPKPKWDDLPLRLVDISAPVRDANGNLIGVICGHLSLDWAFEVRERMLDQLQKDQFDLVVVNSEGKVLMGTPQLPSLSLNLSTLKTYRELSKNLLTVGVERWPDGKNYLTAAVRGAGFRNFQGMGWTVFARRDEKSAFASANQLSLFLLIGGVFSAALFSGVLWMVLRRHLRPLERVAEAARNIQKGDLSTPIPLPDHDGEIADFARSISNLVTTLQSQNAEFRLIGRVFEESGQGIMITDSRSQIVRVNKAFSQITGYQPDEVSGKTPKILQSGKQEADFYKSMWTSIQHNGFWQGEVLNRTKNGHIYPEWLTVFTLKNESGVVTNYIGIFDDITEKKDYEKRLVHLANYDQLTDLPNRNLMTSYVENMILHARNNNENVSLIFIDLDNFKHINDSLGHPTGDEVLRVVASRFKSKVDPGSILARWGGDEFVFAIPHALASEVAAKAKSLIESLNLPFSVQGNSYHLAMSAGIAIFPNDGGSVNSLLRCADTAMYKAKQSGSNFYRFYESTMNVGMQRFLTIDAALRQTIENDGSGLSLVFQPQFMPDGKQFYSAEVLVRWHHPELGEVLPTEFIPVAEDSGQIIKLGRWILAEIVKSIAVIKDSGCTAQRLSMNCSAHQLNDPLFVEELHLACKDSGVLPSELMVEITESAVMREEIGAQINLEDLRSLGYSVSIDDFGTGYSCLNSVRRVRPAEIKIDQSFVHHILTEADSKSIVEFTAKLAQSMGMDVVAEGVETPEQLKALQDLGDIKLQGFLLSRPLTLLQYIELLKSNSHQTFV